MTEKEIARKDAKEAAELFVAACYQVLVNLDVLKEMELIQEILGQIRHVREWLIILDAPTPAPISAPAAETMTIPAFAIPQLPPFIPAQNEARFESKFVSFDAADCSTKGVQ